MSRIAKKAKIVPAGVELKIENGFISAKGPKGEYSMKVPSELSLLTEEEGVRVNLGVLGEGTLRDKNRLLGLYTRLMENAMKGVAEGFEVGLEMQGVGYKAATSGSKLTLAVGFSHPVDLEIPQSLSVTVDKLNITVAGVDKQLVGQFAATIRSKKPPEPYKGKGIRYKGEFVRRKAGKSASK